jgi:hypothetical protein
VDQSLKVIEAFLRDLRNLVGLPQDRVLLVLDGMRYPDSAAAAAGTYFDLMRRALGHRAKEQGYEVIDLDPLFFARHRRTGERFEWPYDGHWNPAGHAVAAEAIMGSKLVAGLTN